MLKPLKRLSDALANQDNILALIRGSAVNQDGASGGLTVPSGPSQQAVIRQALKNSGVKPAQVSYIEAHGTGTSLGDPIEIGALGAVFGHFGARAPLLVGSVKTNIGHLESAAGIAGLIKVVLSMQHGVIPPHLRFSTPNPYIDWDNLPVKVPKEGTPWPSPRPTTPVSFGGITVRLSPKRRFLMSTLRSISASAGASKTPEAAPGCRTITGCLSEAIKCRAPLR